MKNTKLRIVLSAFSLFAIFMTATVAKAAPIRFNQVTQVVNAKPNGAKTGGFTQLRLADDDVVVSVTKTVDDPPTTQDDRVITETKIEVVQSEACDCPVEPKEPGFPKWALLGLAAIPIVIILINRKNTPTPTPTTPTPTPSTPTPTPSTPTPTPTPNTPTPTPTPEPVPEPMTILLFGTGLAGIGLAARRRLRRKEQMENTIISEEEI